MYIRPFLSIYKVDILRHLRNNYVHARKRLDISNLKLYAKFNCDFDDETARRSRIDWRRRRPAFGFDLSPWNLSGFE